MGIFRFIAIWICVPIYKTIPKLYSIFYNIANARFFSGENATVLYNLSRNLYVLISVVMLFVFSATLLSAIVNPDVLTDKKKGVWALVKRAFFGIMMIVIIPFAFEEGYEVQKNILDNNVIEKVFVGISFNSTTTSGGNGGQVIAGSLLSSVLYPAEDSVTVNEPGIGEAYESMIRDEIDGENHNIATIAKNINIAPADENAGYEYAFEFEGLIALIAGGVMLYFLLLFAIDMAVRMFELAFFELTAPIAIVAYIATGEGTFKTWAKELGRVYLNVFIKIASISFYLFMIANLQSFLGLEQFNGVTWAPFLKVIVIVGLFLFIHKLPDILGKFGINIKNRQGLKGRLEPSLKALGAAAGGVGTVGASTAGAFSRSWRNNGDLNGGKRFLRALGASGIGLTGGVLRTPGALKRGYKTGNLTAFGNEVARDINTHPDGSTFTGRMADILTESIGMGTALSRENERIARQNRYYIDEINPKTGKNVRRYYTKEQIERKKGEYDTLKTNIKTVQDSTEKEAMRKDSTLAVSFQYTDINGQNANFNANNLSEAEKQIKAIRESAPRYQDYEIKNKYGNGTGQYDMTKYNQAKAKYDRLMSNLDNEYKKAKNGILDTLHNTSDWSNLNASGDNSNRNAYDLSSNIIHSLMKDKGFAGSITGQNRNITMNRAGIEAFDTMVETHSNNITQQISVTDSKINAAQSSDAHNRKEKDAQAYSERKKAEHSMDSLNKNNH